MAVRQPFGARLAVYATGAVLLVGVIGCGAKASGDNAPVSVVAGGLESSATAAPSPTPSASPTPATIEAQVVDQLRANGAQSATCGPLGADHMRTCTVTYSGGTTNTFLVTGDRTVTGVATSPAPPPPVAAPPTEDTGGDDTDVDTSGATAVCKDGTLSYSQHRSGTCSHHGGVAKWL